MAPMTREDEDYLEGRFDQRYVLKEDCNETQDDYKDRLHEQDTRMQLVQRDVSSIKKIGWLLFSSTVVEVIAALIGILIK